MRLWWKEKREKGEKSPPSSSLPLLFLPPDIDNRIWNSNPADFLRRRSRKQNILCLAIGHLSGKKRACFGGIISTKNPPGSERPVLVKVLNNIIGPQQSGSSSICTFVQLDISPRILWRKYYSGKFSRLFNPPKNILTLRLFPKGLSQLHPILRNKMMVFLG